MSSVGPSRWHASFVLLTALFANGEHPHGVLPCSEGRTQHCCGDGVCNGAEDIQNCLADCPGVTTAAMCGEGKKSQRIEPGLSCIPSYS